jgi:septum site-determining protein MinC
LGSVDLTSTELTSIKALVESMNSEIEFVSTSSEVTIKSAEELNIEVSVLENKVPTPEFDADQEKVNKELEKALDKIFGDETVEIKTFAQEENLQELKKDIPVNPADEDTFQNIETEEVPVEDVSPVQTEIVSEVKNENSLELENFNSDIEDANKIDGMDIEDIDFNLDDLRKSLRETEKLPTLYIQRTLRSGQSITSDGNIVVIGDVNPGSEIIAKGDITVWGVLGGIAHAGSAGNVYARIRALKMNAIQLRIADVFARRPDSINIPYIQKSETFVPEEACIRKKQIIIQKLHNN